MKKKIVILPGDGIGKEVTTEGKSVLIRIAEIFGHEFEFDEATIGHDAIEATGNPLPDETLEKLRNCDAILFGAVGHPKYDNDPTLKVRPEQGLLKMRKELGLKDEEELQSYFVVNGSFYRGKLSYFHCTETQGICPGCRNLLHVESHQQSRNSNSKFGIHDKLIAFELSSWTAVKLSG